MGLYYTKYGNEKLEKILDSVAEFDVTPTKDSTNPVTSDGIRTFVENSISAAGGGQTTVNIGGQSLAVVEFNSDPQAQIDYKVDKIVETSDCTTTITNSGDEFKIALQGKSEGSVPREILLREQGVDFEFYGTYYVFWNDQFFATVGNNSINMDNDGISFRTNNTQLPIRIACSQILPAFSNASLGDMDDRFSNLYVNNINLNGEDVVLPTVTILDEEV